MPTGVDSEWPLPTANKKYAAKEDIPVSEEHGKSTPLPIPPQSGRGLPSEKVKFTGLYVIIDPGKLNAVEFARGAMEGGARIIQLREKDKGRALEIGKKLRVITREKGVLLIINDWADVAKTIDADGVHLGQEDMPIREARRLLSSDKIIGISTHNVNQALEAEMMGANYVGIGPIYATKTKDYGPIGPKVIEELRGKLSIPFVAIGGINENNIDEVLEAGTRNIAMISALTEAEDLKEKVKFFIKKIRGH
jgi:thiamine-phosphate pyrophosphorylase